jgi:hypothetical protein
MKGYAFLLTVVIVGILCLSAVALLQTQPQHSSTTNQFTTNQT